MLLNAPEIFNINSEITRSRLYPAKIFLIIGILRARRPIYSGPLNRLKIKNNIFRLTRLNGALISPQKFYLKYLAAL